MSALTTHKIWNQREKGKEKKRVKRNLNKRSKAKERQRTRSLEKDKSQTPWARATARHIRDKTMLEQRAQTTKPNLEHHKELPLHICKLPLSQSTLPLNQCSNATRNATKSKNLLTLLRVVRHPHQAVRPPGGRLDRPMWPALHQTAQKMPKPIGTPSKCSQVPKTCTNFSPLLTMHESRKNAKSFNI
jgi:hypothetical protein